MDRSNTWACTKSFFILNYQWSLRFLLEFQHQIAYKNTGFFYQIYNSKKPLGIIKVYQQAYKNQIYNSKKP